MRVRSFEFPRGDSFKYYANICVTANYKVKGLALNCLCVISNSVTVTFYSPWGLVFPVIKEG